MTQSLTDIANIYGTDKGTLGPSAHWNPHNYTDVYEAYMERNRESAVTILEIGLGVTGEQWDARIVHGRNTGGASLKMWYDYFPKAMIYGIDINQCSYLDNDRIKTFVADQGKVEDLERFVEATKAVDFDIIVDDGSHRPDHQQLSLGFFFKKLKSGGLYFIEDLRANGLGDGVRGRMACDSIKNTRSVLKHYLYHGNFLEPNALLDPKYLHEHIGYLRFHVPRMKVKFSFGLQLRLPFKRYYPPDTESLCVIRKK